MGPMFAAFNRQMQRETGESLAQKARLPDLEIDLIIAGKEASMLLTIGGIMPDPIAQRLAELPKLNKTALRELWKQLFNVSASPQLRRRLMIPILAYRLQEQTLGTLTTASRSRLRQLARAFEANPGGSIPVVPTLKPGTRLVRQWRDQVHLVNVETSGYEYQGAKYKSLSEVARLITGTRWSGPLFFGIKKEQNNGSPKEAQ
jgi:hypothetical protein